MQTLTQKQRHHVEKLLKDRETVLIDEIRADTRRVREEGTVAAAVPDSGDLAVSDLQADINIQALDRDAFELRDVELALNRLIKPDFDLCLDCDEPIGFERLKANPTTQRCIQCQERFERTSVPNAPHSL